MYHVAVRCLNERGRAFGCMMLLKQVRKNLRKVEILHRMSRFTRPCTQTGVTDTLPRNTSLWSAHHYKSLCRLHSWQLLNVANSVVNKHIAWSFVAREGTARYIWPLLYVACLCGQFASLVTFVAYCSSTEPGLL